MSDELIIFCGGGHGAVVGEAALLAGFKVTLFADDNPPVESIHGIPVRRIDADSLQPGFSFHVAAGSAEVRSRLCQDLEARGGRTTSIVHPAAIVSGLARLRVGVFVGANAVIHLRCEVGPCVILNTSCVVEHDCRVGAFSHIASGAILAGGVSVGERCLVGMGARVLPGLRIADGVTVGAGSVVTRDIPAGRTAVGVPARIVDPCE